MILIMGKLLDFALSESLSITKDKVKEIVKEKKIKKDLLNNIRNFDENFNDTELDTQTFYQNLTQNPLISSYFSKIFLSGQEQESSTLGKIVDEAIDKINIKRASQGITSFTDRNLVENYFNKLTEHLIAERKRILGLENSLLLAQLKDMLLPEISMLLNEQLSKPSNDNFKFTSQLLYNNNQNSIISLGERYSPEINVATAGNIIFDALFQTEFYQSKYLSMYDNVIRQFTNLNKHIDVKFEPLLHIDFSNMFDIHLINQNIDKINKYSIEVGKKIEDLTNIQEYYFYNLRQELIEFNDFLSESKTGLWDNPFLMITGDAAIGKSHLLADNVERMQQLDYPIIFVLGQQFLSTMDPLKQIIENFGYSISSEEFLYKFDTFSKKRGKRGCIIIDALNEIDSQRFWNIKLQNFISMISKYENIGVIFSVRTTYIRNIIPENFIEQNNFQVYSHRGITAAEDDEIENFERYYGLDRGELLKIYPEFSSPLFLKLAALSSALNNLGDNKLTWERLLSQYNLHIEKEISIENRLNYNGQYLEDIIELVANKMGKEHSNFLNYKQIKSEIAKKLEYDMDSNKQYLDELIQENLFSKFKSFDGEEKIHFTYEKIRDYYVARSVVKKHNENLDDLKDLIKNDLVANGEYGVMEVLFFMLPNSYDIDVIDLISQKDFPALKRTFIESVPWRTQTLKSESIQNVLDDIFHNDNMMSSFLEKQFLLAVDEESPFNAEWLTENLLVMDNDLRDYIWTTRISGQYNSFSLQFINRIKRNYKILSLNQLRLALKQLLWLLSSVNGKVRDSATKTISLIFIEKPELISDFLESFIEVTDLYILERLYAAIFGAIVKIIDTEIIESTAKVVYEAVFNQEEVVPHVLLRDYARLIIEFALSKKLCLFVDSKLIVPPYNSSWYDFKFTNEDVDNFVKTYDSASRYEKNSVDRIKYSMITEYGRGTGGYGDFGRYTFGSRVSSWKNQFNDQDLSNIAFKRIFELGFSPKLHANFDNTQARSYDRHDHKIERIGKKYQWIAMYEVLAKLSDNFTVYKEVEVYDDIYQEYEKQSSEKLIQELLSLDKGDLDFDVDTIDEVEMNPEEHLIEVKRKNEHYFQAPFEDYVRTIDPTYHLDLPEQAGKLINYALEPSLVEPNIFNNEKSFVEGEFEGKKYINLYFYYENKDELQGDNYQSRITGVAFFSKNTPEETQALIQNNIKNYHSGVSAPESGSLFLHELYWSPAYSFLEKEYSEYEESIKLNEYAAFEWDSNKDFSIDNGATLYIPSKNLVDYFSLFSIEDGVWKDNNGELIAFDGRVFGYERALWFDQLKLITYLDETNQKIFWRAWGEEVVDSQYLEKWFLIEKDYTNYKIHISKMREGQLRN